MEVPLASLPSASKPPGGTPAENDDLPSRGTGWRPRPPKDPWAWLPRRSKQHGRSPRQRRDDTRVLSWTLRDFSDPDGYQPFRPWRARTGVAAGRRPRAGPQTAREQAVRELLTDRRAAVPPSSGRSGRRTHHALEPLQAKRGLGAGTGAGKATSAGRRPLPPPQQQLSSRARAPPSHHPSHRLTGIRTSGGAEQGGDGSDDEGEGGDAQAANAAASAEVRGGRELSATTYGDAWYRAHRVLSQGHTPAPFLGAGRGGSELLEMRRQARAKVERILDSVERKLPAKNGAGAESKPEEGAPTSDDEVVKPAPPRVRAVNAAAAALRRREGVERKRNSEAISSRARIQQLLVVDMPCTDTVPPVTYHSHWAGAEVKNQQEERSGGRWRKAAKEDLNKRGWSHCEKACQT
eukprot:COSAG01_NODE_1227_length_11135_cov_33.369337_2_plen_407_part_00